MRFPAFSVILATFLVHDLAAQETRAKYDDIRPVLAKHCFACHGAVKPKGDLRLDTLKPDFADPAARERWQRVLERIESGEMPPKAKPRPDAREVRVVAAWIEAGEEKARRTEGRVVLRRLNRVEYENTLRDLLGVEVDVQDLLPLDSSLQGFDNVGEALHVSSFHMERYLEAADVALNAAIANAKQPPLLKKRYFLKDQHHPKTTTEKVFRKDGDTLVLFSSSLWNNVVVYQFYPSIRGHYRFRISAQAVQSGGKPIALRVLAGPMLMATKNHLIDFFDVPAGKGTVIDFTDRLEARSTIAVLPWGLTNAQTVDKIGADKYAGPGVAVDWVEVEGPLHDTWPPESHRRLFGDLPQGNVPAPEDRYRLEVVSKNPEEDAAKVLRSFARRAFRRKVTDDDIKPYLGLVKNRLAKEYSFEKALRVGFKAILASPDFLYISLPPGGGGVGRGGSGKLDDFALASRLSYFLWSTMPDEELLSLAERGELTNDKTLRAQVERMLKSPKAAALTDNFTGQWLSLRDIDSTQPDHLLYPEFDELLKYSMVKETHLFFSEMLRDDLSVANFVHADFSFLNQRLAKHYGIPGIDGQTMRKVKLPPDSHRGGVLTMASVLKVTANGTYTSPVVRGAWVLDRILGKPPSPPPEGVSAVEPDIRGATTIREQLAKHRTLPACAACHVRIDPPGFALESFDVIGGWRDHYRSLGRGEPVTVDGRRMPYHKGLKVDPSDVLPDGRRFANIDELKKLLLEDKEQIARNLTERLLTYATGAPTRPADRAQVEAILERARARDFGLRSLVHAVVQSEAFRSK
ncbi:MAG: DUF1592 domain-containing protein [Gemmataceae bacterium]